MLEALRICYFPVCIDLLIRLTCFDRALICVMSFLLLKAPGSDPRKEIISAPHEEVIGKESLKELLERGSFWSISGQTREPRCTLYGGRKVGQSDLQGYASGSKELHTALLKLDNEQQQVKERDQARKEPACVEQQQVWEESFVDGLMCKLVTQFCYLPESSTACPQELDREFKDLSLQDTKLDTSVSCLEGDILKHAPSPASLEGPAHVGESDGPLLPQGLGKVAALSIESNGGPTKLKSVLRGGYEKAGLGPRPKMRVSWAPDVYDPPCTSTSHTSSQNHRRHHHPRSEHKNGHKGKGSSRSDPHKKSQKKMLRRSKHAGETFLSGPTVVSQRGILNDTLMWNEYITPLDDLTLKSAKVSPFILPPKGCFLNPVLSLGGRDLVTW